MTHLETSATEIELITNISILWEYFHHNTKITLHTYITGNGVREEDDMLSNIISSIKSMSSQTEKFTKIIDLVNGFVDGLSSDSDEILIK